MTRLRQRLALFSLTFLLAAATPQQKAPVYLQLTDEGGQPVRGDAVERFYERQITVTSFSGVTAGVAQVQFSAPSSGATAVLAAAQTGKQKLAWGLFTVLEPGPERWQTASTVRLEGISVLQVKDADGSTAVTLQADRIGTTYFRTDRRSGVRTVADKQGYDFVRRAAWTAF